MIKQCGSCSHFKKFLRYTGETAKDLTGECSCPVIWPVVPACFENHHHKVSWPMRMHMYAKEGKNCQMYEERNK